MQYARINEVIKNDHIQLEDGLVILLKGYTKKDKELFVSFVNAVNEYGYGIKSKIE